MSRRKKSRARRPGKRAQQALAVQRGKIAAMPREPVFVGVDLAGGPDVSVEHWVDVGANNYATPIKVRIEGPGS